jgi:hypothetical protein
VLYPATVRFGLSAGELFSLVINTIPFEALAFEPLALRSLLRCALLCGSDFSFIVGTRPSLATAIGTAPKSLTGFKSIFVTAGAFVWPKVFLLFKTRGDRDDYNKQNQEE